ncbi:fructokinase-1 [Cajanus cajan]|uniref:Fructokinase-1 n=1 Tax=Cajanus cajan TaxID=3821 RepID=A0A151S321_CAJCA|nr:fructokinase-1 [Cajanus cajan]KYP49235.1 Fructokinase-1 [Cajanus cajan]
MPLKTLKSPIPHHHGYGYGPSKPKPKPGFTLFPLNRTFVCCRGLEIAVPRPSFHSNVGPNSKHVDVATLSNLCVDIVLNVPQLPPPSPLQRKAFMDRLAQSPPDKKYWEAGGNCNMAIAAARLGLDCISIGHVGNEIYGKFLSDVLHEEGIGLVGIVTNDDIINISNGNSASYETLLCWVLVDPLQRHGFCSRADFSKEPAFPWMSKLSSEVKIAIKNSKVLFCNGYGFDELSPGALLSAMEYAVEVGTSIFFDPGPRGKSLSTGTPDEQRALNQFLRMSDVLLLTSDEAESLTGIGDPVLAGQELLKRGIHTKWVIVKMGSRGSILITASSIACAPAFKVNVIDTVGCGDSFVAAIAYGFIHNMPLVNTLAIANAVGAATAMGCGAGRNVATLEKVVHILRSSNLNEDDEFWTDILEKNVVAQEITYLSNVMNGNQNQFNLVPFDKVVSELLPKFELPQTVGSVPT